MTATRIAGAATLAVGVAVWIVASLLLWQTTVPDDLELPSLNERAIFGAGLVEEAQDYERLFHVTWLLGTLGGLAALAWMARRGPALVRGLGLGRVNAGIIAGAVTITVAWAVSIPFGLVNEWWQRRHGISTQSYVSTVFLQWGVLLGTIFIGFIILAIFLGLAKKVGRWWWAATMPVLVGLIVVLQLTVPYLLTIDTHPLRDPELAADIRELERRVDAGDPVVREETVSDTTTAANAYAVGIGPTERMIFWDTLLDGRFSDGEVRVVAAHELAHLARDHPLRAIGWFALFTTPVLAIAAFATQRRGGLRNPATVPLALLVIVAAQLVASPLRNAVTRNYETEADWIALEATRDPRAARGLFRGFASTALHDPTPPWWAHILLDDHPTALERIELSEAWRRMNP
jgi:STE24 endopeptidase